MIFFECEHGILYHGDCLEVMPTLGGVDMVLTDPPYGQTECAWDAVVPFDEMWRALLPLVNKSSAIVFTASQPFTSAIVSSNYSMFKYSLVWQKNRVGCFAQAPYRFLSEHEDIVVFSSGGTAKNAKTRMVFNPQGVVSCVKKRKGKTYSEHRQNKKPQDDYVQTLTNYPKSILKFDSEFSGTHPTQKPVALMEYLIKTYTNTGDTVLDFTCGSGTTAVAAIRTGRRFICIEKEKAYCDITVKRIKEELQKNSLFLC